ncbi:hypothetical protein YC2023_010615 [Brassica napus]
MDDDGNECDAQEKGADENMDDDVQNGTQEQERVNANNWRANIASNMWTDAMHMGFDDILVYNNFFDKHAEPWLSNSRFELDLLCSVYEELVHGMCCTDNSGYLVPVLNIQEQQDDSQRRKTMLISQRFGDGSTLKTLRKFLSKTLL